MTPQQAWVDFMGSMQVPDIAKLRAIFLGGYSAGLGHLAQANRESQRDALREVLTMLEKARREDAEIGWEQHA